jgi:hypothetical protein
MNSEEENQVINLGVREEKEGKSIKPHGFSDSAIMEEANPISPARTKYDGDPQVGGTQMRKKKRGSKFMSTTSGLAPALSDAKSGSDEKATTRRHTKPSMPIEPVIIEINRPMMSNSSAGSSLGSNIREESFEESEDSDFSVGTTSSNQRVIKLRDLDDDLTEMIAEAYESARKFKSVQQSVEERMEQIETKVNRDFAEIKQKTVESIDARMEDHTNFVRNVQKDLEDEVKRRIREKSDQDMSLKHAQ